ncbi:ATP-binding protein [Terrihabitans sp. B22-R8]|uniref:ATP-binding protein n=1 Tax=Terrihabitans sp. B22-R8 TaxID=3425128 RepID=UPI00403C8E6D
MHIRSRGARFRVARRGLALSPVLAAVWPAGASAAPFSLDPQQHAGLGPLAISLGLVFVTTATTYLFARWRIGANEREAELRSTVSDLRARLDRTEALIAAEPQIIVTFNDPGGEVEVDGALEAESGVPAGRRVLGFGAWLSTDEAVRMEGLVDTLRTRGEGFETLVRSRRGQHIAIEGRAVGGRALLRIRCVQSERLTIAQMHNRQTVIQGELDRLSALLDGVPQPAWLRAPDGRLTWVNPAYARAVEAASPQAAVDGALELFDAPVREAASAALVSGQPFRTTAPAIAAGQRRMFDLCEFSDGATRYGMAIDVSDLEDVRGDLARRTASHRKTLDELHTGVAIFRADGRLAFHNQAFRQIWKLDPGFLIQEPTDSTIWDRLRGEEALPEPPNFREWKAQLQEAYRAVEPREHWWHLPDGRTMRVVQTPNPEGGVTYLFDDVSERINLESRYNSLIRVQRETLDVLGEGVAVFGSDGRLRLFNPVFAAMWRLAPAELDTKPHADRVFAMCRALHEAAEPWTMLKAAITAMPEGRVPAQGRIQRTDGVTIDIATVPLPDGATVVTFSDITASVAMERMLIDRNEALEAADRLKNAFVKHVSYELRSPLTNIIGFTELLVDPSTGPLTPRQRDYAGHVLESSASLYTIINDILDLATIDAGAMELELDHVDVRAAVQFAVEGVRGRLADTRLTLEITIPNDIGTFIADEKRIRQVLFNLLSNAIGFSPEGEKVSLSVTRQGEVLFFTVSDNGPGIAPELLERVFDRFESHTEGSRHRGAGLGLSIVRSFVELHGGTVAIDSHPDQGTRVTCTFPLNGRAAQLAAE